MSQQWTPEDEALPSDTGDADAGDPRGPVGDDGIPFAQPVDPPPPPPHPGAAMSARPGPMPGGPPRPPAPGGPGGPPGPHFYPPPPPWWGPPPQKPTFASRFFGGIAGTLFKLAASAIVLSMLLSSMILNLVLFAAYFSFYTGPIAMPYQSGDGPGTVAVLPIVGPIDGYMAEHVRQALATIEKSEPDAVVLRIESGGGGVTPSDQIWRHISDFRLRHPRTPVVASFGAVAASGGYYVAMPADAVVAEPTCITGSIGVMAQVPTFGGYTETVGGETVYREGLMDKIGVKVHTLVATGSPEKAVANDPYGSWTARDTQAIQPLLDAAYAQFIDVVQKGRPALKPEQVQALATGEVYTAQQAKDSGLVDAIGYLDDAVMVAAARAGLSATRRPDVTIIQAPASMSLLGIERKAPTLADLHSTQLDPETVRSWLDEMATPRLSYRIMLGR